MIYLEIFWVYFQIGLFSVGGSHASIPVIQSMVVEKCHWMTMQEFTDMITISEMTPGPMSINSATFVGMKVGGVFGGIVATLSTMLPSLIIAVLMAILYKKYRDIKAVNGALSGIRPAATALICSAGASLVMQAVFSTKVFSEITTVNWVAIFLVILTFVAARKTKINSVILILIAGSISAGILALADYLVAA